VASLVSETCWFLNLFRAGVILSRLTHGIKEKAGLKLVGIGSLGMIERVT
jgi:hypothetical protein